MKLVSKAAAFGAAAALTTTGLVAAGGAPANAATVTKPVTYSCDLSALGQGSQQVTAAYSVPALTSPLAAGKALPAQPISAKVTFPTAVSAIIVGGFQGHVSGTVKGNVAFGPQAIAGTLTIPDQTVSNPAAPSTVNASGSLAAFTPTHVGANAVNLPSAVTAALGGQSFACKAVAGSSLSLGTVTVDSAAKAKLAKDKAKLKKAKKAYKKAHGAKKAKLHKKVVKIKKAIKKDKKAIKAGK